MGKIAVIILVSVMLISIPTLTFAEEPFRYNFASAQGNKHMQIIPGSVGTGMIYFYNIDGNRITHITLKVSKAPDNWQVEIQPPLTEILVEINGRKVTITENLHIEPSEVLSQEATDIPPDMVCISVPNRGYVLAKMAKVIVRVPEFEEIGNQGEINISAIAEWLGQTGAAAVKQGRDFDFSIEAVSGTTRGEEKILEEIGTTEVVSEATGSGAEMMEGYATPKVVSEITGNEAKVMKGDGTDESEKPSSIIERWLPAIISAVIVVIGAASIPLLVRRKREKG